MFDFENRNHFLKILSLIGMVAAGIGVLLTAVSGWALWKWIRCMDTVQKSLPTIKKRPPYTSKRMKRSWMTSISPRTATAFPFKRSHPNI